MGESRFLELRTAYEHAFRQFSFEVNQLRAIEDDPATDRAALEETRRRVAEAQSVYREARDRLVDLMLAPQGQREDRTTHVRELAHRLWEESGRPTGMADEHWRIAEQMLAEA
jgi:hypothetical protein